MTTNFNEIHNAYLFIKDRNRLHECHDLYWMKDINHLVDLIDAIVNVHLKYNRDTDIAEISVNIEDVGEKSAEICKEIKQKLVDRLYVGDLYFMIDVHSSKK